MEGFSLFMIYIRW